MSFYLNIPTKMLLCLFIKFLVKRMEKVSKSSQKVRWRSVFEFVVRKTMRPSLAIVFFDAQTIPGRIVIKIIR